MGYYGGAVLYGADDG